MLASLCAFAVFNLDGRKKSYIFNIVALISGFAFTLKCIVHNNDRSLIAMILIASHWGFCLLAYLNETFFGIDECYMTLRLIILGALAAKAYQNIQLNGGIQDTDFSHIVYSPTLQSKESKYTPGSPDPPVRKSASRRETSAPHVSFLVDQNNAETPVRASKAQPPTARRSISATPGYQPMDPLLRETLQKIRTELDTALRATGTTKAQASYGSRNFVPLDGTQPSSFQSRLHTLRDQLRTGWFSDGTQPSAYQSILHTLRDQLGTAVPSTTAHRTSARCGTELNTGVQCKTELNTGVHCRTDLYTGVEQAEVLNETAECVSERPSTACSSEYQTAACASEPSAEQGDHERASLQNSPQETIIDNPKVTVYYGDLITNPMSTIQFSTKENYKRVVVTNLATETIMWSLKAELKGSFDATPAYGLLRTSEQQVIVICLTPRKLHKNSANAGKIAIDYAFVHPFTPKFDKNVFRPLEKRRHILQAIIC